LFVVFSKVFVQFSVLHVQRIITDLCGTAGSRFVSKFR
jgi:hypothetical protein